ncbi:hypothetical protein TGPRC2_262900 [Toxoplasma gondii TgCatPRC2]|uniref:Uncharacterized protein n=1 Tax=Toxoplasma gondii TgCatPRC2 TaxID=1130821 RepID=A0A151HMW4_TOXGO|nr:hypothetical protein TGPRC2_262900 [Toxoplasma gondii TgCatPRC2]
MCPTRLLDAFSRAQEQHPARPAVASCTSSVLSSSLSSSSSATRGLSDKTGIKELETERKLNLAGFGPKDASPCSAGGKEKEEGRGDMENAKEERSKPLISHRENPSMKGPAKNRGGGEKKSVSEKVKDYSEMIAEPALASAEIQGTREDRSSEGTQLGGEKQEAPREVPRVPDEIPRLASEKRDACRKSSSLQTSPGLAPGLSATSSGNVKPQKQTRLPNSFFVSKPASLFAQKPSTSGPEADKVSGDDQNKSTEIKDAQTSCLPVSEKGEKTPRETPSCSFLSSSGSLSASCNTSESGEFGAAAHVADEEASADVHAEEELFSQPPEAQKTENSEDRQKEGAGERHEVAGGIQEAKMRGDEPIEGTEEAAHALRGHRPVEHVSGEVRRNTDPSGDPVEKESLSNCGVDSSCASSSPASSSCSVSSSSPSSSSSGSSASSPTFSAVPSSSSPSSFSPAFAPERSAAAVEAAVFVEGESKTRQSGGEADKAREENDERELTQTEGGVETVTVETVTVETDDRGAQGRARAALREAWGAIFKRPSRQGDQKSKPISGVKKEEGEKKDEESASKRSRHSLKRENEEATSGPSVWEREAGRSCRLGGRARPRRSAGDALQSCPEKRDKREVEEVEVEKVVVNGKETSECRRRSERVLARQKRTFSDSEQVLSVSDSEKETEERCGTKKRQKDSAPTLLLSRRFPVAPAKAERRGQPKRACAASSFQRAREESSFFSGGKRKGSNEETERQLKLARAEEERRQREEVILLRRRVVLQAQQRQREREEEHRLRLLVETNAEWIESLRTFEDGGLDGSAPSWFPGASPRCRGSSASVEARETPEDNRCLLSQASIQDSLNSSEDSSRRPRSLQRERMKRRRASSEEEDIVTSDGTRSREEMNQTRPGEVELEEDRNTAFAHAEPFEAAETSALSLCSAPPRCEWRDVRARLLDLCGLRGFDTRDIVFFVTSGPFTFYTRKGILKILEKTGLPVTTTPRRATCILTNDMGYWPQAEPPSQECPASSFHSPSVLLPSSFPSAESENSEDQTLSVGCSLAPGSLSFCAPWRLSPCFFDGPRVATESVLMRAMNISLQDAARRFHPLNDKSGLLVEDLVRASLHFYANHGCAPEADGEKANIGGRGTGAQEAHNSVSQIFPVEDGAQEEGGAGLRCIEAVDRENEGRARKEDNTGKTGTAAPADPVPPSISKEERSTSQPTSTTSREKATTERHADSTSEREKPGDKEGVEYGFPGTGVLKTPSILWLTHITEMWDRAFEACSLCELAGNNDAVLELHALLTAALQRGPSLSGKRAEFDSMASDSTGTTEKPGVSLPRPKKTERCSGSGGARVSGRKREAKAQRDREERPRVILVSMPPGCGGDRLVDLLCFACGHQAVREQKLREEKRIDGLFLSMAMVSAQARALKETQIQDPAGAVVVAEDEIRRKRFSRDPPEPPSCTPFGAKAPGKEAPTLPTHAADLSLEKKAREGNSSTPSSAPSEGACEKEQGTRQRTVSLPLPRLSVYDWWTLSRADQRRLLQRRPRKPDTENGGEKYNPPVLCIARWREGEDEQTAKEAVNASIDEAICRTGGGRGRRAGASSGEDDDEDFKDAKTLRRGIHFVGLRPPPREALVQRVLAIATAAIGAPVDRALVELLFASSGDGHQGPSTGEAVPLAGILHTLHLVTRTHMNSRLLHAAYHYETQRHLDAQHRELDACASLEGAQESPKEPLPSANTRGSRPSFTLPAASWYDAEPEYCTKDDLADAMGGPSCEETTAGSAQARLSRIIQNFVLPPLERPLPLPFALAEAPLLAFWRLQQAQPMSLLLQLFGSRNALAADSLAAPMHAFDLLYEKFAHTQRAAFARRRAADKTLAEVADRHGSVETLLDAFSVCARAVKLENDCSGCLVVDMHYSVPAGGKASQSGGGKSPSENDFAAGYGGGSSGGSDATKDGLLKENVETALLRGLPLRIGAHLPETTARFVGELILGGVALLQHGPEGAYEPPPLGCSLDAVQKQFVTERMIQQEKLQTRRKLEKVGEGSLKVLDLRRTVEEAGLMVNLEAPMPRASPSVQSDPGEAKVECKGDAAEPKRSPQRSVRSGGPDVRDGYDVDAFCPVEGLSDSEDSDKWMEDDVNMFEIMSANTMLRCTEQLRQTFIAEGRMLEKMASSKWKGGRRVRGVKKKTTAFPDDAKIAKVASTLGNFRKGIK